MSSKFITGALAASILAASTGLPSLAAGDPQPTTVKFGYFNLAVVKASYPESAGIERLKATAETQLRNEVDNGNKMIQKMQEEKKEKAEIEKAVKDLQIQISAKQEALQRLVQANSLMATQAIQAAVDNVAKDKSLDVVVDGAGVFSGGEKLLNHGVDITEAVVTKLQPQSGAKPTGAKPTGTAK